MFYYWIDALQCIFTPLIHIRSIKNWHVLSTLSIIAEVLHELIIFAVPFGATMVWNSHTAALKYLNVLHCRDYRSAANWWWNILFLWNMLVLEESVISFSTRDGHAEP